ncbi:hypothetical protein [Nocardia carnea]|uniref:hypothetical protein n=1 Tax=Nocardia carnea TaxID=37328 RepID=UPI00245527F0|nr:hypothetical protein [Nocardia carnea]
MSVTGSIRGGNDAGLIAVRWQSVPGKPPVDAALRSSAVVQVADLPRELPESTMRVTPAERRELLGRRRAAVLARHSR